METVFILQNNSNNSSKKKSKPMMRHLIYSKINLNNSNKIMYSLTLPYILKKYIIIIPMELELKRNQLICPLNFYDYFLI